MQLLVIPSLWVPGVNEILQFRSTIPPLPYRTTVGVVRVEGSGCAQALKQHRMKTVIKAFIVFSESLKPEGRAMLEVWISSVFIVVAVNEYSVERLGSI